MAQSVEIASPSEVAELRARIEKLEAALIFHTHPVINLGQETMRTQMAV